MPPAFSFFYALITPANIGGVTPVLNQPYGRREFRDREIVACGRAGKASPLGIRGVVIVSTPGLGVAQDNYLIIVPSLPRKIHVPVNDQALTFSLCSAFVGGQAGAVTMKIELGNSIDLHFICLSLIARKIKLGAAGQRIALIGSAGVDKERKRPANDCATQSEQKSVFQSSAPLL